MSSKEREMYKKKSKPVSQLLTVSHLKGPSHGHDSLVHRVIIANNGVLFVKELNVNEKLYSFLSHNYLPRTIISNITIQTTKNELL